MKLREISGVFGLPAVCSRGRDGYEVRLTAPQGRKVMLGIQLPEGEAVAEVEAVFAACRENVRIPRTGIYAEEHGKCRQGGSYVPQRARAI